MPLGTICWTPAILSQHFSSSRIAQSASSKTIDWYKIEQAKSNFSGMNVGTVLETKEFDKIAFDTCCFIDKKVVGPAYAMTTNGGWKLLLRTHTRQQMWDRLVRLLLGTMTPFFNKVGYSLGNYTCVDKIGLAVTCMIVESAPDWCYVGNGILSSL